MGLKYTLIDGALPYGVTLDSNTGYLRGVPDFSNIELGPKWVTPSGSLGTFTALSDVTIDALQVEPQGDATSIVSVNLIVQNGGQGIPWGLTFDPTTWVISGTLAEQKTNDPVSQFTDDELPVWVTDEGSLGTFGELTAVNLQLEATAEATHSIASYFVVNGALPWGLQLNSDGSITGTTAELKVSNLSEYVPPSPIPVWNTPMGSMGTMMVGSTSTLSVSATPKLGTTLNYTISGGALPWGLILNSDGTITGTVSELKVYERPVLPTAPLWPSATTVVGSYSLASKTAVSYQISPPVLTAGASLVSYYATNPSAAMPLGLTLSSSGVISGTMSTVTNVPGTCEFSITALDSNGMTSSHTFQITITA